MEQQLKESPPPYLYKYVNPTYQTYKNLGDGILYFRSPREFNDPYDCSLKQIIRPPSDARN